jgi:spore coat protein H
MKVFFLVLSALLYTSLLKSQVKNPKNGTLFDDTHIHRIYIIIDTTELSKMKADIFSNTLRPASYIIHYANETDTLKKIGLRPKGNTSRYSPKISFRISINAFSKGIKYRGVKAIILNAYTNDPTHIRSQLATNFYEYAGIATAKSGFANLYVNNVYYGLYNLVEHIDEEFLKSRFDSNKGNLYKCLADANLTYLGTDVNAYSRVVGNKPLYELKTNEKANDYSGLIELLDILNNTPDHELEIKLEKRFNVENFLKCMAVEVLLGHWDGMLGNKNNFYLYDNPLTGKFELIPYDFDNTFGIDWFGIDWAKQNIYDWPRKNPPWKAELFENITEDETRGMNEYKNSLIADTIRPAFYRILAIDSYREKYNYHLKYFSEHWFNTDSLNSEINRLYTLLGPSLEMDTSDRFEWNEVKKSFDTGIDAFFMFGNFKHMYCTYGIRSFIDTRNQTLKATLEQ